MIGGDDRVHNVWLVVVMLVAQGKRFLMECMKAMLKYKKRYGSGDRQGMSSGGDGVQEMADIVNVAKGRYLGSDGAQEVVWRW